MMLKDFFTELTVQWILGLTVIYSTSNYVFKKSGPFKTKPGVAAHQLCALFCILYCAYYGATLWFFGGMSEVEDRLYQNIGPAEKLIKINLAFQTFDFVTTFLDKQMHQRSIMLAHHFVAGSCAFLSVYHATYLHYYMVFYTGCSEISTVPLVFVDLFKYFPKVGEKVPTFDLICKALFAILFIVFRVVLWPIVTFSYYKESFYSVMDGTAHSVPVVMYFITFGFALTLLQQYWGIKVLKAIGAILFPSKEDGAAGNKKGN
mmetsp:Transcript_22134/g.33355  ORF Transcript_22134/g.33355 Transcript_22134/m.33355 type:complete len:261 (-) Transcript_22134:345-1127(-)